MPQITPNDDFATVIVLFKISPKDQKILLEHDIKNSKTIMEKKQGFISTSIHKSYDGNKIVNLSQWKDRIVYGQVLSLLTPEEVSFGEKLMDMGASDWNTYRLAFCVRDNTTNITTDNKFTTVINLFSVNPSDQKKLIDVLKEFSNSVKDDPDFASGAIHQSFDGNRVLSYSQWKTKEGYLRFYDSLKNSKEFKEINLLSDTEDDFFDVVYTT